MLFASIIIPMLLQFIFVYNGSQWLKEDLLGYLTEWKKNVEAREGCDPGDQKKMMLSRETTSGIIMTGNFCSNVYVQACMYTCVYV